MSSLYADEIKRVKDLLAEMGRGLKRSLGQNFLVNSQKIQLIVDQVNRLPAEQIVEVGPGLGALTLRLKELGKKMLVIEMDDQFAQYWREQNISVEHADALRVDWAGLKLEKAVLVSNLPYQIGARLVVDRCVDPAGLSWMVLMFQKEVAQRLTAKPKTPDYSLLTVIAQTFWRVERFTDLGPNDYFPPPNVASRVLLFECNHVQVSLPAKYLEFVKLSFSQKRKFLKKSLIGSYGEDKVAGAFEKLGISLKARPEELDVATFVKLYQELTGAPS